MNDILNDLCELELNTTVFIRNYMQFVFEPPNSTFYPCLNVYTDPYIILGGNDYKRSDNEFCNKILTFIGMRVKNTAWKENEHIRIEFSNRGLQRAGICFAQYR